MTDRTPATRRVAAILLLCSPWAGGCAVGDAGYESLDEVEFQKPAEREAARAASPGTIATTTLDTPHVGFASDDYDVEVGPAAGGENEAGAVIPATPAEDRKMVYSASIALEVARVDEAIARYVKAVGEMGGYLSRRNDSTVVCRVPAARFEELLAELRTWGRVLQESIEAQEVQKEHRDLTIRLENARQARERLIALLAKATAVEDILKIETELRRLTDEIDSLAGQLKYLEDRIAMSTVTVAFRPVAAPGPASGTQRASRFWWINRVGAERVLRSF